MSTTLHTHGDKLTCFTAALAGALVARGETSWWRPLLAGGPFLAVTPADTLLRFDHHPAPPLPALGLRVTGADDWDTAYTAIAERIAHDGAAVVLGDVYHLPWQRGYRRWHAPHWLTIVVETGGWVAADPLAMTTELGPQAGTRMPIPGPNELREWAISIGAEDAVPRLREESMAGSADIAPGRAYRWLEPDPDPVIAPAPPERLVGPDALRALASRYRFARGAADFEQIDDLWQALRQRELLLWAADRDADVLDAAGRAHWEDALERWRALPPLLLHARLRARSGGTVNTATIADTLTALAEFEDQHLAFGARRTEER
ncbi:hypothetical protein [Nocardia terpenica]|uniref:Butirosin biosynthesis protein H N-terminal domain-containing protein n=1 Tax=Nocardia terpenica TaxID=455432 RepID=A0A164PA83_9NOCA|nr:hypothetical protein [Nocardia terpenica]KZM75308.1 hypothetical protein AWN90_18085 [Nocardia terpenica]NQE85757.1 hypothetical protein [Nocardia terpenica]